MGLPGWVVGRFFALVFLLFLWDGSGQRRPGNQAQQLAWSFSVCFAWSFSVCFFWGTELVLCTAVVKVVFNATHSAGRSSVCGRVIATKGGGVGGSSLSCMAVRHFFVGRHDPQNRTHRIFHDATGLSRLDGSVERSGRPFVFGVRWRTGFLHDVGTLHRVRDWACRWRSTSKAALATFWFVFSFLQTSAPSIFVSCMGSGSPVRCDFLRARLFGSGTGWRLLLLPSHNIDS